MSNRTNELRERLDRLTDTNGGPIVGITHEQYEQAQIDIVASEMADEIDEEIIRDIMQTTQLHFETQ
jgi:hypothetical protein